MLLGSYSAVGRHFRGFGRKGSGVEGEGQKCRVDEGVVGCGVLWGVAHWRIGRFCWGKHDGGSCRGSFGWGHTSGGVKISQRGHCFSTQFVQGKAEGKRTLRGKEGRIRAESFVEASIGKVQQKKEG